MTNDELRRDDELTAELNAIDASLRGDGAAGLRALAGRPDLLALTRADQATVHARRAVVVDLLSEAALPRRLAALDAWLETHRVVLAAERDLFASLPLPAEADDEPTRLQRQFECDLCRRAVDIRLHFMNVYAGQRATLVARLKALPKAQQEASAEPFSAPYGSFWAFG